LYDCKLEVRVRRTNDGSNDETDYGARDGAKNDVNGNEPPLKHFLESDGLSELGKDQAGKQKREDQLCEKERQFHSKFAFFGFIEKVKKSSVEN
jgi:hypothetical protein